MPPSDRSADSRRLLVAGAGGGLAGALRAAELGVEVVVVEANPHYRRSNNTAMSTAMIPGAGTRFQHAAGVADSPESFVADVLDKTMNGADPTLAAALGCVSGRLVEWLADDLAVAVELATDFIYPGHSVPRCHTVPGRSGAALLGMLARRLPAAGIDMIEGALAEAEVTDDGITAHIEYPGGGHELIAASDLLLATSGFGADPALVAAHMPEIAGAVYHGSEWARGDALRIGGQLGAATAFMDAYQGHGALTVGARTLAGWATVMHGGIIVNRLGRRFADETQGYSEFAHLELRQPGSWAAIIIDRRIHEHSLAFDDFRRTADMGAVQYCDSADELARKLGVPAPALVATLAEVEMFRAGRAVDPFGRRHWLGGSLTWPLAAIRVQPALFHTQGGLRVTGDAQVLDRAGQPIPGLYAAGGAAMGISGHGAKGYLAGNGLLSALGLAFLAAEHAASRPRSSAAHDPDPAG